MNNLENNSLQFTTWMRQEVEISKKQSNYAFKLVDIWKKGTSAYLNMKLRNPGAVEDTKRVLRLAMKYEITEVAFLLSMRLMKYYALRSSKAKMIQIQNVVKEKQDLLNAETQVEFYLTDIDKDISHKISNDKILKRLESYIQETESFLHKFNSLNFLLNAYTLKIRKAQIENDKNSIVSISNEVMERLIHKDYDLPHVVYYLFEFPLISIHIENKNYEEAERIINSLYEKLDNKSLNWMAVQSMDILLNFRRLDFEKVCDILDRAKKYDNDINRERNKIFGAFVSFFTDRSFPLGKFKGELIEHNKDRQGYRVTIIILHLLHLLKYRKYGAYIDKVEAIEKYMQRYLKSTSKKTIRSRYFLKCLMLAAHKRVNFNKQAFQRRTEELYLKIKSTPPYETKQLLEQEPIDFEYLYFVVKGMLK